MLSQVKACGITGIDGYVVQVETDISNGIPAFDMVGLGDTAVRESRERVRAAIKNSGLDFPARRITLNLAPANIKKEGSSYDLSIAVGVLAASEQIISNNLHDYMFLGELGLDGELRPVIGVLPMILTALKEGISNVILPISNKEEAGVVNGVNIFPCEKLEDVVNHLNGEKPLFKYSLDINQIFSNTIEYEADFADVCGQESIKRALEVAASGAHNVMMIGSPGSGKTMLAKRLPTILPPLSFEEAIEVTKIHSIAGQLRQNSSLLTNRPFRSPHHTISSASLVGGGRFPRPGEISLAHYGVLFLDELPEFSRDAFEVLRQPLEDGCVHVSRANQSLTFPARTTLICAANPCKCGNYLDSTKECTCSSTEVKKYLGKLSGPLLDRIDIHIEVGSIKFSELEAGSRGEKSSEIRNRVARTRKVQTERYKKLKIFSNAELTSSLIGKYCFLDEQSRELLRNAFERLGLSARAHSRILKVARTIADMEESECIKKDHVAEAIGYRSLDRRFWNN